jgi:transaldolase
MKTLNDLKVHIYADGADKQGMLDLYKNPLIKGLTTNPSLMKKAGVEDYEAFARDILSTVKSKPISFEVFTDEFNEMREQALKIASWQNNVYVKIPITNSRGESACPLIKELASEGVKLNVTAILTLKQVEELSKVLQKDVPAVVSVFAGRIADTGVDPMPIMKKCHEILTPLPKAELLWASVREVLNIFQAEESNCQIVTVPHDILKKAIQMVGMDLAGLSLDTVKMFKKDAEAVGYKIQTKESALA